MHRTTQYGHFIEIFKRMCDKKIVSYFISWLVYIIHKNVQFVAMKYFTWSPSKNEISQE